MKTVKRYWECRSCGLKYIDSDNPVLKGIKPSCLCAKPDCILKEVENNKGQVNIYAIFGLVYLVFMLIVLLVIF